MKRKTEHTSQADSSEATNGSTDPGRGQLWRLFKQHPYLGIVLASAAGLGAAALVGVGEVAIAAAAGYGAYRVLKQNASPGEAMRETMHAEKGAV